MIAAEHAGRRAYMVEIDAGYCDIIRRRWQEIGAVAEELVGMGGPPVLTSTSRA
jgi:DNA modification methylase